MPSQEPIPTPEKPSADSEARKSPLPLSEIKQRFIDEAIRLRDALAKPIARQHELSSGGLVELGLVEYKRTFGHLISARHWWRLFNRTLERAGAGANFMRLEIYMPPSAFDRPAPTKSSLKRQYLHRELAEIIGHLENKANPTADDRAWLFDAFFAHHEKLIGEPENVGEHRAIKRSLIDYLWAACPGLSKSLGAFRWTFNHKLTLWRENGRSPTFLEDGRHLHSGNFMKWDPTKDRQKIQDQGISHDGNISLAHRKLWQAGEFSPEFIAHRQFNPRKNKSRMANSDRAAITPKVDMCQPLRRGPWEAKMRGPYIPRDWSDVQPGDYFSGDDVTWNHYFRYPDDRGQWRKTRGECLILTDLRTGYPLDFILIAGHYNSEHIRALILKVHDTIGLPHKGFYFENSVWKARLIPGEPRNKCKPLHWRETEFGLQNEGIALERRHATTPRAKPIECYLHILQDRLSCRPGNIGRNERTDAREREQEQLARMNRGDLRAIMTLPTMEEWRNQIRVVLDEFSNDPQNGKMLPGISPMEAWKAGLETRPLRKLPDTARYLFATHRQVVRVRQQGIILNIRGQRLLYCGESTGSLIGQEVIAFYNVECPELLTVSDLKRQNYFTVERVELPAMTASNEESAKVNRQINGHMKAAKAIYGNIKHPVIATVTHDNQVDEATKELGRFHNDQVEQFRVEKTATVRKLGRIQIEAAAAGIALPEHVRNPDQVLLGIELVKAARERIAQRSTSQAPVAPESDSHDRSP